MSDAKLYSIAAIAKALDLPESTLHYWKNRFDRLLPSVGNGRHKRFRPEALEVFRAIGNLLGSGLSVADAKAELSRRFPLNITPVDSGDELPLSAMPVTPLVPEMSAASVEAMAQRMGEAMGLAMAKNLQSLLERAGSAAVAPAALPSETVEGLKAELAQARESITRLAQDNEATTSKLKVLEAELIRLRREGREMEKHLMAKIKTR